MVTSGWEDFFFFCIVWETQNSNQLQLTSGGEGGNVFRVWIITWNSLMTVDVDASTQAGYFRGIWRIGNLFQIIHVVMDFDFCVHKSEQAIQLGCLFVVPDVLLVVSPSTSGSPQNVEQNRYNLDPIQHNSHLPILTIPFYLPNWVSYYRWSNFLPTWSLLSNVQDEPSCILSVLGI